MNSSGNQNGFTFISSMFLEKSQILAKQNKYVKKCFVPDIWGQTGGETYTQVWLICWVLWQVISGGCTIVEGPSILATKTGMTEINHMQAVRTETMCAPVSWCRVD